MEMRDSLLDFNKICRLCLTEETVMSSIYSETDNQSNSVPLPLRIMACVSIEVSSHDGLPSQICATCLCQVDGWYKFKDLCESADNILRKYISNEPVQIEGISEVKTMAEEVKRYFQVKEENGPLSCLNKQQESKKKSEKSNSVENCKDGKILFTLLSCSQSQIKEEQEEESTEELVKVNIGGSVKTEGSSDDETLASRLQRRATRLIQPDEETDDDDDGVVDLENGFSSDDNVSLYHTQKKILRSKSKQKKKKCLEKKYLKDISKQARTIQTQTGTDEECVPDTLESLDGMDDEFDDKEKKKIKSKKTQTLRERSAPKKRFRIRPAVPSSCTLCDKVYKNSEILRQHMKSHHVTGPIECGFCKSSFTSVRSLKYHEQRKHSNLEPVPCSFCGKEFLDKKYLRIHENIHSQANQYVCQFCGRKFIMKTNLTVHISRHHTHKTNDFICQVCGKAFPFKLYLKKHFKTHTDDKPHACTFCEAKFREPTLLRKHINSIHLKLRPFLCQVCHKTFTRSLYLREHMDSQHLGIQKKIECTRCGEHFQNRNRLRQHECEGRLEVL